MKTIHIKVTRGVFFYQNSTSLIWLVCLFSFISIPASTQFYVGENTQVSGEATIYTNDVSPLGRSQTESCKLFANQDTIISICVSYDITYVDKPVEKDKVKHGRFADTRERMTEKSTKTPSRPKRSKPAVSYRTAYDRFFYISSSKQYPVIISTGNSYKSVEVGAEKYKKNIAVFCSKDRISYVSFVGTAGIYHRFYALRGPPVCYIRFSIPEIAYKAPPINL